MRPIRSIRNRRQIGESRIGCFIWSALALTFLYLSWQMVPIKMKSLDLEQFMVRQAERASLRSRGTEETLKRNILQQAEELDLPLHEDDLSVSRNGARVKIDATYTVPINLIVTTWDWKIEHSVERAVMRI